MRILTNLGIYIEGGESEYTLRSLCFAQLQPWEPLGLPPGPGQVPLGQPDRKCGEWQKVGEAC